MKYLLPCILLTFFLTPLRSQDSLNITRLGHWDDDSLPVASPGGLNLQYSGCWGMAVNGREIAVLGGAAHVLFFDVTEPAVPKLIGKFQGSATTIWREFKSYQNRVYAVSDGTEEGLMIFDLSQAPDTIIRTYWSNELFLRSHTITLDTLSGRIYLNGSNIALQGIAVLDVSQDPDNPILLSALTLPGGYIHDSYVRNDTLYASSGNEGFYVFDYRDAQNPVFLAEIGTGGYNHNSWLTTDGRYAYYTEEIPIGRPVRVVDLQQLANGEIEVVGSFLDGLLPGGDTLAIPHNVYIRDNLLFNSQYEDGLLVYDISEPTQPKLIGYYDTHPQNVEYNGYFGNWGNYPWLPSGNIVVGDMQNGLMVLRLLPVSQTNQVIQTDNLTLFPNPANGILHIDWGSELPLLWRVIGPDGRIVQNGKGPGQTDTSRWPTGIYVFQYFDGKGNRREKKIAVQR